MIEPRGRSVQRPAPPHPVPGPRRWLGYLLRMVVGALVMFVLINLATLLLINVPMDAVERAQRAADSWAWVLFLFRLSLYGMIWRHWTSVTVWFARRHQWRRAELRRVLGKRQEVLSYFVLLEMLISGAFLLRIFP